MERLILIVALLCCIFSFSVIAEEAEEEISPSPTYEIMVFVAIEGQENFFLLKGGLNDLEFTIKIEIPKEVGEITSVKTDPFMEIIEPYIVVSPDGKRTTSNVEIEVPPCLEYEIKVFFDPIKSGKVTIIDWNGEREFHVTVIPATGVLPNPPDPKTLVVPHSVSSRDRQITCWARMKVR